MAHIRGSGGWAVFYWLLSWLWSLLVVLVEKRERDHAACGGELRLRLRRQDRFALDFSPYMTRPFCPNPCFARRG